MKTTIKNALNFLVNTEKNNEMITSFNCILEILTNSENLKDAKSKLETDLPHYYSDYFSIDLENYDKIIVKQKKFPGQNFSSAGSKLILTSTL